MHGRLGVAKDDGRRGILEFDDADEAAVALHLRHDVIGVVNLGDMHVVAAETEQFRLMHELV